MPKRLNRLFQKVGLKIYGNQNTELEAPDNEEDGFEADVESQPIDSDTTAAGAAAVALDPRYKAYRALSQEEEERRQPRPLQARCESFYSDSPAPSVAPAPAVPRPVTPTETMRLREPAGRRPAVSKAASDHGSVYPETPSPPAPRPAANRERPARLDSAARSMRAGVFDTNKGSERKFEFPNLKSRGTFMTEPKRELKRVPVPQAPYIFVATGSATIRMYNMACFAIDTVGQACELFFKFLQFGTGKLRDGQTAYGLLRDFIISIIYLFLLLVFGALGLRFAIIFCGVVRCAVIAFWRTITVLHKISGVDFTLEEQTTGYIKETLENIYEGNFCKTP